MSLTRWSQTLWLPYDQRRLLIGRLDGEGLSPENVQRLIDLVEHLEQLAGRPGRAPGPVVGALRDVLQLLGREDRVPRYLAYLQSHRWQQRAMACRSLRDEGLSADEAGEVCQAALRNPNRLIVELAARNVEQLSTADCVETVLPRLESEYWQSRVVEKLLVRPGVDLPLLAEQWPIGTLWAIARNRRSDLLPHVVDRVPDLERDWKRLPIVAWALGRTGASSELDALLQRMQARREWAIYVRIESLR